MRKPPGLETACRVVVSVSANDEDCASLERILRSGWTVMPSAAVASALALLRELPIPIVVFDCGVTTGTWGEMLEQLSLLPDPPLLIVTSRLADERLWAEALNLGAWDVLAKPFDTDEAVRVVSGAYRHWQYRQGIYVGSTRQRKSVSGTEYMTATGT